MSAIVQTYGDGTKEIYIKHEEIGHGGFSKVYRVTNQKTKRDYAIKVIPKERYEGPNGKKAFEKLKNEIKIQKVIHHPNIVKSYGSFSDDLNYYIILEYCPNKSVKELLRNSPKGYLSEPETRKILQDVVEAVVYLHRIHIIHRDLKLENYMIGSDGKVKIADFGVSVILRDDDEMHYTLCGTPNYFSPEILQKGNRAHSYEVDIWAIGVSAFTMLTGHTPFEGEKKSITYENIKNCDYHFPSNIPISPLAKDFIITIFELDPEIRPTAVDISRHKFLTTIDKDPVSLIKQNKTQLIPNQNENSSSLKKKFNVFNSKIQVPVRPRIHLPPRYIKNFNNSGNTRFSYKRNSVTSEKLFNLPNSVVSRYLINGKDLGYLLANGIVGACFTDHSRMIMDPYEEFIQYYQNYGLNLRIINLDDYDSKTSNIKNDKLYNKISLVMKFAKTLKKITSLYDLPIDDFNSSTPLNYIKYYKNQDDAIIFRFNDKNVQVNFNDHKKLFIFWDSKQMCLVRNIKDKCSLMNLNDVVNMSQKTDEYKKLIATKNLMSQL